MWKNQTNDGGYIVTGLYQSELSYDLWLIKFDSTGNKSWEKLIGSDSFWEYGSAIRQTSDGGYIIVGDTVNEIIGEFNFLLIKTDKDGNKQWEKHFGGYFYNDLGYDIQITSDDGYILVGCSFNLISGDKEIWLIKTDSNGNKLWDKMFGGKEWDEPSRILQTSDEGYIIAADTQSYGAGERDIWLIKLSAFENQRPNKPTITGPTSGNARIEYDYTFVATDPDGNDIYYYVDWGDKSLKRWFGPFATGEEVKASHAWSNQGTYTIRARAKDTDNLWGPWGTLTVTIPRNKATNVNTLFLKLLERFPLLERLLLFLF